MSGQDDGPRHGLIIFCRGVLDVKIAVFGAGAIGCYYGGMLARKGQDVTFAARGRTLEQLGDHDLVVKSINGDFSLPVRVIDAEHLQKTGRYDFILLSIKSTALDACIPGLQRLAGTNTKIVCLLNGIGNEEKLAHLFGADRIIGGSAFISIIREAPGVVNHVGEGRLAIGEWSPSESGEAVARLAEAFRSAGVNVETSKHIRQIKWEKLLWNIIYNPLTALTGTKVGEALADPDLFLILKKIKNEFLKTAEAAGVAINRNYADQVLLPNKEVQHHKTSMLQDLENGRKMELDAILGFVIQTARDKQVSVATIENIYHLLRFTERRKETDSK